MCGIAGYFGAAEIASERVQACLALMKRRGPDSQNTATYVGPGGRRAVLLFARLAIIDLDPRADQPFAFGDHRLIYNGELYNYIEVKRALAAAGENGFATTGDTEVLIRQLARHGIGGLDACEGMWAFALYDTKRGTLALARDRFGEKPLYVLRDATGTYFGSEVKFIAALRGGFPDVDLDHLRRYLVNGYKALYKNGGHSFFSGVSEVPAGSALLLDADGGERLERYWQARGDTEDASMTWRDAVAETRAALVRSVGLRLRADVPLAFCLSGGVDSNAIIAIAKREFDFDVHGFTVMNSDARYEERDMVETAVRELGLRHTAIPVETAGFLSGMRALVRQHDAPVYTITYYVQWALMREVAAAGYRVAVSGAGADELFSGYFDHHGFYLAAMARSDPERHATALAEWRETVAPIVRNPYLQDPDTFVRDPGERGHIYLNADAFAEYLTVPWHEAFAERSYASTPLRNRMLNELFHESVPPILHEDDLNAMYYSVENRSPYLDRSLFEVAQRIPTRHLVRNGRAKAVLREAARGYAPDAILDNPRKVGFNAPILDLLEVGDPEVRASLLDDSPIFAHVRKDRIEGLLARNQLPNSESKFLFYFLAAKLFLEEFAA